MTNSAQIKALNTLYVGIPTVSVLFVKTKYAPGHEKYYTYLVPEGLEPIIGDLAVVEKEDEYSIVQIVELHDKSQVEVESGYRYKWLVDLIDRSRYTKILENEKQILEMIRADQPSRV